MVLNKEGLISCRRRVLLLLYIVTWSSSRCRRVVDALRVGVWVVGVGLGGAGSFVGAGLPFVCVVARSWAVHVVRGLWGSLVGGACRSRVLPLPWVEGCCWLVSPRCLLFVTGVVV
jgi:hypothetical protein